MDSFELNKILGAILGTSLVLLALNITAGAIFAPHKPEKPGYAVAVKEGDGGHKEAAPKEPEQPIEVLLAKASAEKGETAAKKCVSCHTFNKGGANKVGPHLWDVVGRDKAAVADFNYSNAMKQAGGKWTFEDLNKYLQNPKGFIPGNKMAFAGISRNSERADVINYLRTLADSPMPLPKVAEGQGGQSDQGGQAAPGGQTGQGAPEQKPAEPKPQ